MNFYLEQNKRWLILGIFYFIIWKTFSSKYFLNFGFGPCYLRIFINQSFSFHLSMYIGMILPPASCLHRGCMLPSMKHHAAPEQGGGRRCADLAYRAPTLATGTAAATPGLMLVGQQQQWQQLQLLKLATADAVNDIRLKQPQRRRRAQEPLA